jgi:tRNA pseudouridine38-40 synthase
MRNIKLTIEFDGTNYAGWQKQKNAVTVQQQLEDAIYKLTRVETKLTGSSRTDAGVHARGFVANFFTESSIPTSNFQDALNSKLPRDIVILNSEEVELNFHSRYSCTRKQYSYTILNRTHPAAIDRNFVYHYKNQLNFEAMSSACKLFLGQHDFSAFKSTGSSTKSSIRTVKSAFIEKNNDKVMFFVEADGFLYSRNHG